jgi:DNA-directed RNA polymerase subunit L
MKFFRNIVPHTPKGQIRNARIRKELNVAYNLNNKIRNSINYRIRLVRRMKPRHKLGNALNYISRERRLIGRPKLWWRNQTVR